MPKAEQKVNVRNYFDYMYFENMINDKENKRTLESFCEDDQECKTEGEHFRYGARRGGNIT